jgi:hypothetical protein
VATLRHAEATFVHGDPGLAEQVVDEDKRSLRASVVLWHVSQGVLDTAGVPVVVHPPGAS